MDAEIVTDRERLIGIIDDILGGQLVGVAGLASPKRMTIQQLIDLGQSIIEQNQNTGFGDKSFTPAQWEAGRNTRQAFRVALAWSALL